MLFDVLSIRCTRTHYVVVLDDAANFVASCGKVPLHESRWWIIISCKNVIGWCRDMKEKADDLETFRERFRRLCWLDGPNRSIIMLYLKIFDVRWFLKNIMLCLCVLFSDYNFCYIWLCSWIFIPRSVRPFCSRFGAWQGELCPQNGVDSERCMRVKNV